jgi:hypothetical protein
MDWISTIVSGHSISFNPLSLLIFAWLLRIEKILGAVLIAAARREETLNGVSSQITDLKAERR